MNLGTRVFCFGLLNTFHKTSSNKHKVIWFCAVLGSDLGGEELAAFGGAQLVAHLIEVDDAHAQDYGAAAKELNEDARR